MAVTISSKKRGVLGWQRRGRTGREELNGERYDSGGKGWNRRRRRRIIEDLEEARQREWQAGTVGEDKRE